MFFSLLYSLSLTVSRSVYSPRHNKLNRSLLKLLILSDNVLLSAIKVSYRTQVKALKDVTNFRAGRGLLLIRLVTIT